MSKKFFSLIRGDNIHIAPGTKIIPSSSLETLVDAQNVLKEVREDAESYKMEITTACEKLKDQARKEGFEKGYAEWVKKIADLEDEIRKVRGETEQVVIPIALKAAKKIVGRELELSKSAIVDIISNSLRAVASHKRIKIHVNKKDFEIVDSQRDDLKQIFENLEALSVRPNDDVAPGGCIIETEGGIINAQLENQWLILENAFQKMMKARPPEEVAPPPLKSAPQAKAEGAKITPEAKKEILEAVKGGAEEEEEEEEDEEWDEDEDEDEDDEEWEDWDEDEDEDEEEEDK